MPVGDSSAAKKLDDIRLQSAPPVGVCPRLAKRDLKMEVCANAASALVHSRNAANACDFDDFHSISKPAEHRTAGSTGI